ncbi:MAG: hypothetical protein EHM28_13320 [Spirochaetaceae bacterium]|nr:MAG: hypothetical protein EHM28_13320 [Spirochaetaceae bacterium]
MKKLSGILLLAMLVCTAAMADNILTIDVGYLMANFTAESEYFSQNSLALNFSMFIGDDALKVFVNGSFGYVLSAENDIGEVDLDLFDSTTSMDFIGGIGGRFFLSENMLFLVGVGAHLYWGIFSESDWEYDVITAGIGAVANLVIIVDNDLGVNVGVKAAFDPLTLSQAAFWATYDIESGVIVMPYVGMSIRM